MDIGNTISQWVLGRLESLPAELLQQVTGARTPERFLDIVLGDREATEVRALLDRAPDRQSSLATVLLPGVMGSLLASTRGISTMLWLNTTVLADGQINLLDLDDTGQADRSPDVEIVPVGIEKMSYLNLILMLARETRLYEFPYDWRRSLEWNADILSTCLQRWAQSDSERRFALVGHSMGGMLARTFMARYPQQAERYLSKVVMIGTPLYGSPLTALLFSGQTVASRVVHHLNPANDVRSFVANMPSSYQLLPPPPELFAPDRPYPANWDFYDASAWRLDNVRQDFLDQGRRWHKLIAGSDPQVPQFQIAGCHQRTLTDLWLDEEPASAPEYTLVHAQSGPDSGDGAVPLWSVSKPGVTTYFLQESHQMLPASPRVLEQVTKLLHDEPVELPETVPQPVGLLRHLAPRPLAQQVAELRQHLETGGFSREDIERILFAR